MDLEKFETAKQIQARINNLKQIRNRLFIEGNPAKTAVLLNTDSNKYLPSYANTLASIGLPSEEDFLYLKDVIESRIAHYEDLFKQI